MKYTGKATPMIWSLKAERSSSTERHPGGCLFASMRGHLNDDNRSEIQVLGVIRNQLVGAGAVYFRNVLGMALSKVSSSPEVG